MNLNSIWLCSMGMILTLLLGCSHEGSNTINYYETREEAINDFFEYEGFDKANIINIDKYLENEIIVFLDRGIGFAFIEHTENGYRIFFDGPFRDFQSESKEMDGNHSYIELTSANGKNISVIIGKIFNKDIQKVAISDPPYGTTTTIPIAPNQEYWYFFFDGKSKNKEITYEK